MTETLQRKPALGRPSSVFISPLTLEGGVDGRQGRTPALTTAAYITANAAMYVPFVLPTDTTITRFFWVNGTTASTNYVQVGVYDSTGASIVLGTGGSPNYGTLAAGASQPQFDNVTDFTLAGGRLYYMALWCSGTTTHFLRAQTNTSTSRFVREMGIFEQVSLTTGLPTTASFATVASHGANIWMFGLTVRASP